MLLLVTSPFGFHRRLYHLKERRSVRSLVLNRFDFFVEYRGKAMCVNKK